MESAHSDVEMLKFFDRLTKYNIPLNDSKLFFTAADRWMKGKERLRIV